MIPIIWRYLLSQYLKVTGLCVVAFIVVLLTMRLEDIAHFASLDPTFHVILLFVLFQIPYILPIVIPIACLISAILLMQRLSKTHELTALRACGISIKDFLAPILISAGLLSILNFYVVSELATESHFMTGLWKLELRSVNPLLLLRNKHLMKVKGGYFEVLGSSKMGETASQAILALPSGQEGRIALLLADRFTAENDFLHGEKLTLITGRDPGQLLVENIDETYTSAKDFSQIIQQNAWDLSNDHLKMSHLLAKIKTENEKKEISRGYSEIIRRLSVAFAAFSFTLMGLSFGISISRNPSARPVVYVIILAALYLGAYFTAKGIDHLLPASTLLYTVTHALIILFSIRVLWKVSKGIE